MPPHGTPAYAEQPSGCCAPPEYRRTMECSDVTGAGARREELVGG